MWEDYSHYLMVPKLSIRTAIQLFLKDVEHITSPSIKSCEYLESILKRKDILHIPNFIDEWKLGRSSKREDIQALKTQYNISRQDTIITFVGRVSSEKRVFQVVKIYDTLIFPKNPDIKLMVIGDGKDFKKIQKYVSKSQYQNNYKLESIRWST